MRSKAKTPELPPLRGCDHCEANRFRVLLTIVPPRPNRDGPKAREALLEAGLPLFQAQVPRLVSFQRCILDGQTVYSPEYREVTEEVESLVHQTVA